MITDDSYRQRSALDSLPLLTRPRVIQISVFVKEARSFLNTYFRGSWIEEPPRYPFTRHITISVDCFAYFTKVIFKRVFNRELIKVTTDMSDKEFSFTYHFNTSYLEEKDKESLALIAEETKCTLEIDESSATLKAPVLFSTMLNIYAGRPLSVYNALKDAFLDDHIFPV